MTNNEKNYYIYIRSTGEKVLVTREEFDLFYEDIHAYRRKKMRHGQCVCPESKRLHCDMDCGTCPFRRSGDIISLDYMYADVDGNEELWINSVPDDGIPTDIQVENEELLRELYTQLKKLSPRELEICKYIINNINERQAATKLNIPRGTYRYQRDLTIQKLKSALKKFL